MENGWIVTLGPGLASAAVFLAIVLGTWAIYLLSAARANEIRRRLQEIQAHRSHRGSSSEPRQDGVFLVRWLEPAGELILPQKEWRRSVLRRQLVAAGYRRPRAIYVFLGAKLACALGLFLAMILLPTFAGNLYALLQARNLAVLVLAFLGGFFLPDLYLRLKANRRRRDFIEGFPDALDMLVVCVEAGLGLDAAIDRVAQEMSISHPALSTELALISLEIRAGKSREESLRSMAQRMDIDQVHALSTLLIQAERFGTSVASALRGFADEMRTERIQRARETAAKLPVKLIFPVVLCIFPALFLVVLGPAITTIFATFLEAS